MIKSRKKINQKESYNTSKKKWARQNPRVGSCKTWKKMKFIGQILKDKIKKNKKNNLKKNMDPPNKPLT